MTRRRRTAGASALSPWPGYVDALSTLLMVTIFVLLVFVLSQQFLTVALNRSDAALDRLGRQVAELADQLSLERGKTQDLTDTVAHLTGDLQSARLARDDAARQLAQLQDAMAKATAARTAAEAGARDLKSQAQDLGLRLASAQSRIATLTQQLADAESEADRRETGAITRYADQVRALLALRDQLQSQLGAAQSENTALTAKLGHATGLAASEEARLVLLSRQIDALRDQLSKLSAALELAQRNAAAKDAQIADLGTRLNAALASKVAELQKYRSEFFGRLRDVLAHRPGISIVGDRFVFQSEVLFPSGSADLTRSGAEQIRAIATTLKSIARDIPPDLSWVLRVDGHADRQKIRGRYTSNWELSAERAITVVKLLIAQGIPPAHLAAAGFGEYQPLDPADTPAAYARNRRIELRLTDR